MEKRYKKKANPKAPRVGKKEFSYELVNEELYRKWLLEYPEYNHYTFIQFRDTWDKIARNIWELTATDPDGVRLPFYCGDLEIKYVKTFTPPEEQTREEGPAVPHLNFHTNGKLGKIIWSIKECRRFNRECRLFCFHAHTNFQDRIHKALKETPEIFKTTRIKKLH